MTQESRLLPLLASLFCVGCVIRPYLDHETEAIAGVGTMNGTLFLTAPDFMREAVSAAERDCAKDRKDYAYVSHSVHNFCQLL